MVMVARQKASTLELVANEGAAPAQLITSRCHLSLDLIWSFN